MRIWVDMTAPPHPLVLRPIVDRLRSSGHEVAVTTRAFGQTGSMLDRLGISHEVVGRHGGGSAAGKAWALAHRSALLVRWARRRRFDLALSHGSVDLAVVCRILGVPAVQMQDYEFAGLQRQISFRAASRVLVPEVIPLDRLRRAGATPSKLRRYAGLKEDYYLSDFTPDPGVIDELRADAGRVLAVVRPPDDKAAYRNPNRLYQRVLDRLSGDPETVAVVLPRYAEQRQDLRLRGSASLIVPTRVIDAQSLIAYADLVVSAGGTMNREAVALGTPAYTIFSGRLGAVDEGLIAEGLLRPLSDPAEIELRKRARAAGVRRPRDPQLLVDGILAAERQP